MANATRMADKARGAFIGRYTGTTAAQNINIGFKPSLIIAYNQTDGNMFWVWASNDTAHYVKIDTAAATVTEAVAQVDDGTTLGFSLPACSTTCNGNTKVYVFIAFPS